MATFAETVGADLVRPILLFRANFLVDGVETPLLLHSGYGTMMLTGTGIDLIDGVEFAGAGHLVGFESIGETTEMEARQVTFTLSGIPQEMVGLALASTYKNRPVWLWLAALGPDNALAFSPPRRLFRGRMDVIGLEDYGHEATFRLVAENHLVDLRTVNERRYTHADQQALFPGDRALEYVAGMQDRPLYWGRATPGSDAATPGGGGSGGGGKVPPSSGGIKPW